MDPRSRADRALWTDHVDQDWLDQPREIDNEMLMHAFAIASKPKARPGKWWRSASSWRR